MRRTNLDQISEIRTQLSNKLEKNLPKKTASAKIVRGRRAWLTSRNRKEVNDSRKPWVMEMWAQDKAAAVGRVRNLKSDRIVFQISVFLDKLISQYSVK